MELHYRHIHFYQTFAVKYVMLCLFTYHKDLKMYFRDYYKKDHFLLISS